MVETKEHKDAFNQYYLMGAGRSLRELARLRKVSAKSAMRWSKAHNWQERIELRDIDLSRKTEEKIDEAVVNTRADYRKDVKLMLQPLKALINSAIATDKKTGKAKIKFEVDDARDMASIVSSYEKLIKVDLLLMGEADSHTRLSGDDISFSFGDKITKDDI